MNRMGGKLVFKVWRPVDISYQTSPIGLYALQRSLGLWRVHPGAGERKKKSAFQRLLRSIGISWRQDKTCRSPRPGLHALHVPSRMGYDEPLPSPTLGALAGISGYSYWAWHEALCHWALPVNFTSGCDRAGRQWEFAYSCSRALRFFMASGPIMQWLISLGVNKGAPTGSA